MHRVDLLLRLDAEPLQANKGCNRMPISHYLTRRRGLRGCAAQGAGRGLPLNSTLPKRLHMAEALSRTLALAWFHRPSLPAGWVG